MKDFRQAISYVSKVPVERRKIFGEVKQGRLISIQKSAVTTLEGPRVGGQIKDMLENKGLCAPARRGQCLCFFRPKRMEMTASNMYIS